MSIRLRIAVTLLVLSLAPLIVLGLGHQLLMKRSATAAAIEHLNSVAELQHARLRSLWERNRERVALIASRTQLRVSLEKYLRNGALSERARVQKIIHDAKQSLNAFENISVVALNGDVVASTDEFMLGRFENHPEFLERATREGFAFDMRPLDSGEIKSLIAAPLVSDGRKLGLIVIRAGNDDLAAITSNYTGLGETGETLVARRVDERSALLLARPRFPMEKHRAGILSTETTSLPIAAAFSQSKGVSADAVDYRGTPVVTAYRFDPDLRWAIAAKMDVAEIEGAFAASERLSWLTLVLTIILTLIAYPFMSRTLQRPIRQLLQTAEHIEQGDLERRASVDGPKEFAALGSAFNSMLESLSRSRQQLTEEIELRARLEARFRSVTESAPTAMLLCSPDGIIALVNAATEDMFAYSREELIGQPVEMLIPRRYRDGHPRHRNDYFAHSTSRTMGAGRDLFGLRKDGIEVPIEIGLNPIETEEGQMVMSAIVDLTERQRIESDLVAQNRQLAEQDWLKSGQYELAERMRGVSTVDRLAMRVLRFLCDYLGAHAGTFYSTAHNDRLSLTAVYGVSSEQCPQHITVGQGLLGQALQDNEIKFIEDCPAAHFRGESSLVSYETCTLMLVPLRRGSCIESAMELAVVGSFTPTQRELVSLVVEAIAVAVGVARTAQSMELLLEESREKSHQLETANQYKSEFLANMSHELRTPLNSMLLLAQTLASNRANTMTDNDVIAAQTIERSGRELLHLINDILDMSKIEAGKLEVAQEVVELHKELNGLIRQLSPLAAQKQISIELCISPNVPATVISDGHRLSQILKNLLSNAVKFTEVGGVRLVVDANEKDNRDIVSFRVIDTGIGIPSSQHSFIFAPFQQADGSISRRYEGTGLGLTISLRLAELLGGTLVLESSGEMGSTFTLEIPAPLAGESTRPDKTDTSNGFYEGLPSADRAHCAERVTSTETTTRHAALALEALSVSQESPQRHASFSGLELRVLIIDNDMRSVYAATRILNDAGLSVAVAMDEETIELRQGSCPLFDVVIADGALAAELGERVLTRLLDSSGLAGSPTFVLLGAETAIGAQEALGLCRVSACLTKPVDADDLLTTIRQCLDGRAFAA